jgi:predicted Zn-dependent protease
LGFSRADQTEVLISGGNSALTRFANNYIHQNVEESNLNISVRVVFGKRIGVATCNQADAETLRSVVERASLLARFQVENEAFTSLPSPKPVAPVDAFIERTARCGPEERAAVAATICQQTAAAGLTAAGHVETAAGELAVANSLGVWASQQTTTAEANLVVMSDTSSGWSGLVSLDVGEIDGEALAAAAIDKAVRSRNPVTLEPGQYAVILEHNAVADLAGALTYLAFGAQAFQEHRSFLSGRLGERVLGENVSIRDDGRAPDGIPSAFDYEGVPKQRVDIIERGIARGVVYDTYYGGKEGKESTGHALPAGNTFGPIPWNLQMAAGDSSLQDMIAATGRGLLVTRFWYTRPVHYLTVTMTGMTRDGTFLIEDGRITGAVKNLRYTQSYVEALNDVAAISRETTLEPSIFGYCRVPAIKINNWNINGSTE